MEQEPEPELLGVTMKKHYLPVRTFSIPFSERIPIFQLKFWLRSKLLPVSGNKKELLDRIRSSKYFNGETLDFDTTEAELSFQNKRVEELTVYQLRLLLETRGQPTRQDETREALIARVGYSIDVRNGEGDGQEINEGAIKRTLARITRDRDLRREMNIIKRIANYIEVHQSSPKLEEDEIEILEEYGFKYDEETGYIGVPQLGIGVYKESLQRPFFSWIKSLIGSKSDEDKEKKDK